MCGWVCEPTCGYVKYPLTDSALRLQCKFRQNCCIEDKVAGSILFNLNIVFFLFCHILLSFSSLSHVLHFTCPTLILGPQLLVPLHILFCQSYLGKEIFTCFIKPPWGLFQKIIYCICCECTALWYIMNTYEYEYTMLWKGAYFRICLRGISTHANLEIKSMQSNCLWVSATWVWKESSLYNILK